MTKLAAVKTTNETGSKEEKVRAAKRIFLLGLVDLSWKLALLFLVPVLAGIAIDRSRGGESQAFTLAGVVTGFILSFIMIIRLLLNSKIGSDELGAMKKVPEEPENKDDV